MKGIALERTDGGISIIYPNTSEGHTIESVMADIARVLANDPALTGATVIGEVDSKDLPSRASRDNWRKGRNGKIETRPGNG